MPLFKKHTNDKTNAEVNNNPTTGTGGTGIGHGMTHHEPLNTTAPAGGYHQPSAPSGTGVGYGGGGNPLQPRIFEGQGTTEPYPSATGTGVGHNLGQQQTTTIPPSNTLSNTGQTRGGTGQKISGRVEAAVGNLVGSETLKARGFQKEQEANAIKLQGQELAEAERLEREAMARRERAVGHGAHPANRHPGSGLHDQY